MEILNEEQMKLFGALIIGIILAVVIAALFAYTAFNFGRVFWAMRSRATYRKFQRRMRARDILKRRKFLRAEAERRALGKISWSGLFYGGLVLIFAASMSVVTIKNFYNYERAKIWRATDCTVISFKILSPLPKSSTAGYTQIVYRFEADGSFLTGDRYQMFPDYFDKEEIRRLIEAYQPETHFQCYYNPANPRESVATQTGPRTLLIIIFFIAMIICYPVSAFIIYDSLPHFSSGKMLD